VVDIMKGCSRNGVSNFGKKKEWPIVMLVEQNINQCISIGRKC
jgi:hypothetical protein